MILEHAKKELRRAGLYESDSDYNGALPEAVLELLDVFCKQGHSGASAAVTLDLFNRLACVKTLSELTNDPAEWMNVTDDDGTGRPLWQSRRQSTCFSHDGGQTYYDIDEVKIEGKFPIHYTTSGVSATVGTTTETP